MWEAESYLREEKEPPFPGLDELVRCVCWSGNEVMTPRVSGSLSKHEYQMLKDWVEGLNIREAYSTVHFVETSE